MENCRPRSPPRRFVEMGRTSKFTFPVPGRKQKPPFGPIVSGPMSKAQKILGTAEINIDAPRQWDSASNSGISVCVSESTATYNPSERSRAVMRHEEEGSYAGNNRSRNNNTNAQWEQESEIVPAFLTNRFAQLNTEGSQREFTTETSSLARRGSNSTITSWYDKTKMPLSISQQTSSSAMAKGLPQKANAVLDIEGQSSTNVPAPLNLKAKKRPSRLDLGPLLSRAKHNSLRGKSDPQGTSSVHGHEYTNRSPSLASVTSPKSTPPPIQQRIERKLTRKSTYDSLNSTGSRPRTGSSSRRGANDISTLPNLYEHYEQMSFDSVLGHDGPLAAASTHSLNSVAHTPLRSPSTTDHQRRNFSRPPLRQEGTMSTYQPQFGPLPESTATPSGHQQTQPDRDCASSVSSRYTKTSKASKRTSQSLNGSDLMEKSVLSLSSDSEDDFFPDSVSKFTGGSRSSDAGSLAPSSLRSTHSRDAPSLGQGSRKSVKHASFAPTNTYLTIPSKSPPSKPPSVNARMSSLPSTTYRPPPAASNRTSQYSTMSTSTTDSLNNSLNNSLNSSLNSRQSRASYGVQEARVIAVLPPQESHANPDRMMSNPPQRMLSTKSSSVHSVDQPTPPMSPTSVESFMSSGGGAAADANNTADSRFMAVTRQEEMLLAALRMKRARMRESILAEYEDESRSSSSFHQRNSSQGTITEMDWPEPPQTLRHQTSATSNSTIKAGSRASDSRPASLVRGRSHQRSNSRHLDFPAPSSQPVSGASSRTGSMRKMRPVQETTQSSESSKQERILLYLDRPVGNVNSMDFAEPSPDLSDFMDFDNVSEEDEEFTSSMSMFRNRDHHRFTMGAVGNKSRGRMLMTGERVRHESSPLRPRGDDDDFGSRSASTKRAPTTEIVESDSDVEPMFGIPRPDSPVSPEGTLGLPHQGLSKKKAVRLSAVGNAGVEAGWWGDDG
ncbi:hypothetical protein JMJ77_0006980 [Colletotrichum scovillei]|uniref:Uncharacterized protein n=2 Tax=Colletotrichum scovillei TaxID=1209932 RepID=A0A9P7RC78_9PEZI|nr:hypothetical protein JMJ77_0006980 [Colletotrichum scovillei]KAG7073944.1 hypothetical protein JMJ76_0010435 [Colletotrichum scovillei]KAG7081058.1 hypothetical protein JMJ78_0003190 [Colletotrichum scovillei]